MEEEKEVQTLPKEEIKPTILPGDIEEDIYDEDDIDDEDDIRPDIDEEDAKTKEEQIESSNSLEQMTVKDIKTTLDEKGIEYDSKAKKEELVKLLEGAE